MTVHQDIQDDLKIEAGTIIPTNEENLLDETLGKTLTQQKLVLDEINKQTQNKHYIQSSNRIPALSRANSEQIGASLTSSQIIHAAKLTSHSKMVSEHLTRADLQIKLKANTQNFFKWVCSGIHESRRKFSNVDVNWKTHQHSVSSHSKAVHILPLGCSNLTGLLKMRENVSRHTSAIHSGPNSPKEDEQEDPHSSDEEDGGFDEHDERAPVGGATVVGEDKTPVSKTLYPYMKPSVQPRQTPGSNLKDLRDKRSVSRSEIYP